ncbi:MAG: hypothetical protein DRQ10_03215 [Candidatus Hydrothermota bacterium]|nr:MAG: hypothetical protein DRQ10_03215 [Candidatus Hydrothermae bacterium]
MPDIFTHFFVANTVLKDSDFVLEPRFFYLGSQGADLFYYAEVFGTKVGTRLGFVIHRRNANLVPQTFAEFANNLNEKEKHKILSYASGFITHFWADALIHPWIIYRTGIYDVNDPSTVRHRYLHKSMESAIDFELAKWLGWTPPIGNLLPHKWFLKFRTLPKSVADAWAYFTTEHYGVSKNVGFLARMAYLGFRAFSFVFFPPNEFRFKVAKMLERITPFIPWTSYLTNVHPKVDVMNRSHSAWFHPCFPDEERHESVFDLFQKAVELSRSSIQKFLESPCRYRLPRLSLENGVEGHCHMVKFEIFEEI